MYVSHIKYSKKEFIYRYGHTPSMNIIDSKVKWFVQPICCFLQVGMKLA